MHVLLRMHGMRRHPEAPRRRLLRFLLVWLGALPAGAGIGTPLLLNQAHHLDAEHEVVKAPEVLQA